MLTANTTSWPSTDLSASDGHAHALSSSSDHIHFIRRCWSRAYVMPLFFAILLLIGLLSFRSYGFPWDDRVQLVLGESIYQQLFHGAAPSADPGIRYYGPWFEFLTAAGAHLFKFQDVRPVFLIRHFLVFCTFVFGVSLFWKLAEQRTGQWQAGLLAATLLVLSPRIFADAFYNTKDIPTLAFFIASAFTLLRLVQKQTLPRVFLHALATGLLIGLRLYGILFIGFTFLLLSLDAFAVEPSERASALRRHADLFGVYCVATILVTFAVWPLLWHTPFQNIINAYRYISSFGGERLLLTSQAGPNEWYYLPSWIAVTTPLVYDLLILVGLLHLAARFFSRPLTFLREEHYLTLLLLWGVLPILLAIVLGTGLYNAWRHFFFVYPALLLIAVEGARYILRSLRNLLPEARRAVVFLVPLPLAVSMILTTSWMVRNHPLQNVYFSIAARFVEGNFRTDYWGLSFKQGFDYVLATDPSPVVLIHPTSSPGFSMLALLTPEQRQRVRLVDTASATYILDNFVEAQYKKTFPDAWKVHSVTVDDLEILNVYKRPATS